MIRDSAEACCAAAAILVTLLATDAAVVPGLAAAGYKRPRNGAPR